MLITDDMNSNAYPAEIARGRSGVPFFEAACPATEADITAIHRFNQCSPFNSPSYAAACSEIGKIPCAFTLKVGTDIVTGCLGFMGGSTFSRCLEIVTLPQISHQAEFWAGVIGFCQRQGVWDLFVESYCSTCADIPLLPGELTRRKRYEFVLTLDTPDLAARMSRNNRYNIRRARNAGISVRKAHGQEASQVHLILRQASMARRRARGEDVMMPVNNDPLFEILIKLGTAEIFQAYSGENALSSLLVLRSDRNAYALSAGTSPEGMRTGASAYVFAETAAILRAEGVHMFNIGGGDSDEERLRSFKAGFGGIIMPLEAVSVSLMPLIKRKLRAAARLFQPNALLYACSFRTVLQKN
jgi:hypothetical protein